VPCTQWERSRSKSIQRRRWICRTSHRACIGAGIIVWQSALSTKSDNAKARNCDPASATALLSPMILVSGLERPLPRLFHSAVRKISNKSPTYRDLTRCRMGQPAPRTGVSRRAATECLKTGFTQSPRSIDRQISRFDTSEQATSLQTCTTIRVRDAVRITDQSTSRDPLTVRTHHRDRIMGRRRAWRSWRVSFFDPAHLMPTFRPMFDQSTRITSFAG
jgi:hypothetical protein